MAESQRRGSIPPPRPPLRAVPTGPFNGVKLGLVLLLLGGVLLIVVLTRLAPPVGVQLAVLASYGLGGMVWAVVRIRRILREVRRGPQ